MKALVVYESMWGNTREIAEAVASGLGRHVEVGTVDVQVAPAALPADLDLIVLGGPTHADGLREWLDRLPSTTTGPAFAIFDTRLGIARPLPSSAGRKVAKMIADRGYRLVSEPHSFYVHGHDGPLEHSERSRAALWGERVALEAQLAGQTV